MISQVSLYAEGLSEKHKTVVFDKYHGEGYKECVLGGRTYKLRTNASFTPYIDYGCSARCRFCSETLSKNHRVDIEDYDPCSHEIRLIKFQEVIRALKGFKIELSISGLEPLLGLDQVISFVNEVERIENEDGVSSVEGIVMYSNLSEGKRKYEQLKLLLAHKKFQKLEISRHHYEEDINNLIMRYLDKEAIANIGFRERVSAILPLCDAKLVCVMQKGGIESLDDVRKYLDWSIDLGFKQVGMRQLAIVENVVDHNETSDYCISHLVDTVGILKEIENDKDFVFINVIRGYYFFTFNYKYKSIDMSFSLSDYNEMIMHHNSEYKDKLILYPNGTLCYDWDTSKAIY